jgi:lipopolysaccharide export system permease protein
MPMIFQRAAIREFTRAAVVVFSVLVAILTTTMLIRLLGQAASGGLAPDAVVALLMFSLIGYLPVLLSLTLFISVLSVLSRWYRDSEMVIWLNAGLPLSGWLRPVLRYALPFVIGIGLLSLLITPWAARQSKIYQQKMDSRSDVSRVSPGVFNESVNGDRIFFVESAGEREGVVKNVFVSSVQQGRQGIMATATGHTETMPNGDRFLVLEKGRRYEGVAGLPDYRVMEFERYAIRIETKEARGLKDFSPRIMATQELLQSRQPGAWGELLWRLGFPLAALNLAFFAIPLSFVNPRAGRASNLVFAILIYMIYANLLSVSQAWVAQEKIRFDIGVWLIHAVMFLLLLVLFYRRQNPLAWKWIGGR